MILNNLCKWRVQHRQFCADTLLLIAGALWLGLVIYGLYLVLERDAACVKLEESAREKRATYIQEQVLEAQAKAEREAWIKKILAERPQTARIMAVQWRDAGKRQVAK